MPAPTRSNHFCYLLRSINPKYTNSTYIGYTVNPKRRIRQHNREITNGAMKTHKALPWEMIVVVYGFPNQKEGLRFEWAWQHPTKSKICKEFISETLSKRRKYISKIEIAMEMLCHSPWNTMDIHLDVTSYDVNCEVHQKLEALCGRVLVENHPLQYLYDSNIALEESYDADDIEASMPSHMDNSRYDEEEDQYVMNSYCSEYRLVVYC